MTGRGRAGGLGAVVAAALSCAGCLSSSPTGASEAPAPSGPTVVYAAIGGNETAGFDATDPQRQAWPLLYAHTALPEQTVVYDLAGPGQTAADAVADQLPAALEVHPQVVTVWLGPADLLVGTPPSTFGSELGRLLGALRQRPAPQVLVADMPPLSQYPAYSSCQLRPSACPSRLGRLPAPGAFDALVSAYDVQIQEAARAEGATVVGVGVVIGRALADGRSPTTGDDFDLTTTGHQLVATAFERASRAAIRQH